LKGILMSPNRSELTPRALQCALACVLFSSRRGPLLYGEHRGPDRQWR
jgi:hypothetical protein